VAPTDYGLLNQILGGLGLAPIDLKSDAPMLVIVIANGFIGASFGMIIFTSAIRSIPQHLFHAAQVDGAGGLAIVRHVTLPQIRWQLSFVTLYQALSLLMSFEYIWLITDGGPFYDTTVYALYVYKRAFDNGQYAYGAALALGLVVVGIAVAMLLWRFFDMRTLLQKPRIEVS
jgi:inositol-phosphate transport system permease protein